MECDLAGEDRHCLNVLQEELVCQNYFVHMFTCPLGNVIHNFSRTFHVVGFISTQKRFFFGDRNSAIDLEQMTTFRVSKTEYTSPG